MSSAPFPVLVHPYPSPTRQACAYELLPAEPPESPSSAAPPPPRDALVFVGGLGDGPHTVPYVRAVAAALRRRGSGFSVFEARLRSSFDGFGTGSLARDAADLGALVRYLRDAAPAPAPGRPRRRVVLMGHSTGCQDCVAYAAAAAAAGLPAADAFVLQGSVSDREGIALLMPPARLAESLACAAGLLARGRGEDVMPRDMLPDEFDTPLSAYRWYSLAAVGGDDDFFSSDLPDERVAEVWGRFQKPVLIVPSEKDEHVSEHVDFARLLARWRSFCPPGVASELCGLIPGANHTVDQPEAQEWLADRVATFLEGLEVAE